MSVKIGLIIKNYCDQHRISGTMLSKMIGRDTSRIYRIFRLTHINTGILLKLSTSLNHNFFQYFWEDKSKSTEAETARRKQELVKLKQENDELKRKNEILRRENELLNKFLDKMKPA